MNKFHINSKGEVAECRANKRVCRFGEESHFDRITDAVKEVELRLSREAGSNLKTLKKDSSKNSSKPEKDSYKISRVKKIENLAKSKDQLKDFGKRVRFTKDVTIEDVELTARNADYNLRNSRSWSSSIVVETDNHDSDVSLMYSRMDDSFELREQDDEGFNIKKPIRFKKAEDAMLYIADNYRF